MDIKTLLSQMRPYYKSLVSVYCPILNETIYFSSDGFNHLIFDTNRKPRNINEQYLKLKYLPKAREVIEKCPLVTETRVINDGTGHEITFYCLEFSKTRVIIKRKGTGKHKFQSVMPILKHHKNKKRPSRRS